MLKEKVNVARARPTGLPDFADPPLNEVVLGVQFSTPKGYQQIYAGNVWELFKNEYPVIQEHPPLVPTFETFGLPHPHFAIPPFTLSQGTPHNRYWFLRPEGEELIQFQSDKFLHNWRKNPVGKMEYPRYETIIERFQDELSKIDGYMANQFGSPLAINQCEITYINHVVAGVEAQKPLSEWLNIIGQDGFNPDDVSLSFRETLRSPEGSPLARIYVEINTAYFPSSEKFYAMNITVRGAPSANTVASAIEFMDFGRVAIVDKFTELTTSQAHTFWKRQS